MKYVKMLGTFGAGKTTHVREICRQLTGVSCDDWERKQLDEFLCIHQCKCGRYAVIGSYASHLRCCGADRISAVKGFNFVERLKSNMPKITATTMFEEGIMTQSLSIQEGIKSFTDYNAVWLNITAQQARYNVEVLRKGHVKEKHLQDKIKCAKRIYDLAPAGHKWEITEKDLCSNAQSIIKLLGIERCACQSGEALIAKVLV